MDDICTACLCKGRKLHFVGETGFHHLYAQILNEIPICDLSSVCIRVCWECRAALHRCHVFKELVKTSYNTLLQHLTEPTSKLPTSHPHLQIHRVSITTYPDIKSEPDVSSDVTESVSKPQTNADLEGDVRPQFNVDLIHGDVRPQFNVDIMHGDVRPQFNVGVEFEMDCIKDEESELHCEPETFVNDLERVGKRTRSKKEKENKKSNVKKKKAKVKSKKKKAKEASDSESIRDYAEEMHAEGEEKETDSRETGEKQEALSLKESPVQTLVPKAKTKRAPRVSGAAPERPQCVECGKMFSSKKTYRYHLNVLHKGQNRYPCPRCGKVYQWKSNLGRHLRSHTARDSGELYCAPCDKRFSSVATHRQHLRVARRHVSESEFSFMCNECGKKFVSKTRLRDHIDWEHLHKIKFTCQLCNKPFKCHTSLYVHLQNVHRNKEKRDNLCHVCGKSYQNAAKLKYHIVAMHTHETPYQCGECGAAFGWYSSLYRHVREVHYKMKLQPNKKPKRSKRPDCPPPALAPPPHPAQTPHPAQG